MAEILNTAINVQCTFILISYRHLDILDDLQGGAEDLLDQLTQKAESFYDKTFPCAGFNDAKESA